MSHARMIDRLNGAYFLYRLGAALRETNEDIVREEMPPTFRQLLTELHRVEALAGSTSS
jgi:hypothetical protein